MGHYPAMNETKEHYSAVDLGALKIGQTNVQAASVVSGSSGVQAFQLSYRTARVNTLMAWHGLFLLMMH